MIFSPQLASQPENCPTSRYGASSIALLALLGLLSLLPGSPKLHASVVATTNVVVQTAGVTVTEVNPGGVNESSAAAGNPAWVFQEQSNLAVGTVPAGADILGVPLVNTPQGPRHITESWYVVLDPEGNPPGTVFGPYSITFDKPIVAIYARRTPLSTNSSSFRFPGVDYSREGPVEFSSGDQITLVDDYTIEFDLFVIANNTDNFRILLAPEPSRAFLFILGYLALCNYRRRLPAASPPRR